MSYGIIRVEKYKKGSVKGLQIHDQRQKEVSHTNKDIDFSKSDINYELHSTEVINFTEKVNGRIKELNLKKRVRYDAVVMCQCLITSGYEFFDGMTKEQQDKFFKDSYNFLCHRYGKQNIVSATVHFDERTPHMHVNFVPVTDDGRLCAKDLFKKKDLSLLHDDFYKFNKSRGYNLQRGESVEDLQKHLSTEEFKLKKEQDFLKHEEQDLKKQQAELKKNENTIQNALSDSRIVLENLGYFNTIEAKKTLLWGKITLSNDDYKRLHALATQGTMLYDFKIKYEELSKEYEELKKKVDIGINEKLEKSKDMSDLVNKYNLLAYDYNSLINEKGEFFNFLKETNLSNFYSEYQKEKIELKINEEKDHDWDMEM